MTFAAAALAYVLIRRAQAYAEARRREAEFLGRRLRAGRYGSGKLYPPDHDPVQPVVAVAYERLN